MAGKFINDYFKMLAKQGECAKKSALKLQEIIQNFSTATLEKNMEELHALEHEADELKHLLLERLAKEFITPIEREDILRIASQSDDVIDYIEDILIKIYMFNIRSIIPDAHEFIKTIVECSNEMHIMLKEFHNFKKSKTIHGNIVEINRLEGVGDHIYMDAVHKLYKSNADVIEITAWREVFMQMERCCDACEHTANLVEEVIMKNS